MNRIASRAFTKMNRKAKRELNRRLNHEVLNLIDEDEDHGYDPRWIHLVWNKVRIELLDKIERMIDDIEELREHEEASE